MANHHLLTGQCAVMSEGKTVPRPPQLRMFMTAENMAGTIQPPVPEGFTLRTFREGDADAYIALMQSVGFNWSREKMEAIVAGALPEGIFFLEENVSGKLVATAMANRIRPGEEAAGGEMGWVGVAPEYRGKHLAAIVCAAVVRRFLRERYRRIFLKTDDFRIPAIKTYLKSHWQPQTDFPGTAERWNKLVAVVSGAD